MATPHNGGRRQPALLGGHRDDGPGVVRVVGRVGLVGQGCCLCAASIASLVHSCAIRNQVSWSSGLIARSACRRHSCASLRKRSASVMASRDNVRTELRNTRRPHVFRRHGGVLQISAKTGLGDRQKTTPSVEVVSPHAEHKRGSPRAKPPAKLARAQTTSYRAAYGSWLLACA